MTVQSKLPFAAHMIFFFSDPTPTRNYISLGVLDGAYLLEVQTYLETCGINVPVTHNVLYIMTYALDNNTLNVVNHIASFTMAHVTCLHITAP
jgi:hypothetical protein